MFRPAASRPRAGRRAAPGFRKSQLMRRTTKKACLHRALMNAEQPQAVGPAALAELQIVGVIDHAAGVGILVIDPHRQAHAARPGCTRRYRASAQSSPSSSGSRPWVISGRCGTARPRWRKACGGQQPPARRAVEEAQLQQIGLDDVLDGVARFGQRGGDGVDAHRAAAEVARRCRRDSGGRGHRARGRRHRGCAAPCRPRRGRWSRCRPRRQNRAPGAAAVRRCGACRANAWRSRARHPPRRSPA